MRDFWFTAVWSPPLKMELRERSSFMNEASATVQKVTSRESVAAAVEEELGTIPITITFPIWKACAHRSAFGDAPHTPSAAPR